MYIKEALKKVVKGQILTERESEKVLNEIIDGNATSAQIGALLTALRIKGETVEEITGFAKVMRQRATKVIVKNSTLMDMCGTGGDGLGTFNISTTAAFVVAGAGITVAKHGNHSVSSLSGSADVLEALGVNINLTSQMVARCLENVGIAFLFAPTFHKAMKNVLSPRREIGIRTIFNILGPLTNPAEVKSQVIGVYDPELTELMAQVLRNLGVERAYVIHGAGGVDELSLAGVNKITSLMKGKIENIYFDPLDFGFSRAPLSSIAGGNPYKNAEITKSILDGEIGPKRDTVILNAAFGIMAAGITDKPEKAFKIAQHSLDSGTARRKLDELISFTNLKLQSGSDVNVLG